MNNANKLVLIYNNNKEIKMESLHNIIEKVFIFDKEPQKIGLSQFKEPVKKEKKESPSLKNKNVKLSDLMRRD